MPINFDGLTFRYMPKPVVHSMDPLIGHYTPEPEQQFARGTEITIRGDNFWSFADIHCMFDRDRDSLVKASWQNNDTAYCTIPNKQLHQYQLSNTRGLQTLSSTYFARCAL